MRHASFYLQYSYIFCSQHDGQACTLQDSFIVILICECSVALSQTGACQEDGREVLAQIHAEEAGEPEDGRYGDGSEEKLGMVEERQGVVPQEGYNEVVVEGSEIEGVGKGEGDPGHVGQYSCLFGVGYRICLTNDLSLPVACRGTAQRTKTAIPGRTLVSLRPSSTQILALGFPLRLRCLGRIGLSVGLG
jgi:hypothetical protein